MILEYKVHEQTLEATASNSIARRRSRKYLKLRFYFSEDWSEYTKTVFFQYEGYSLPVLVESSGEVEVPEYFTQQDHFMIMLVGIDGEESCPTNVLCVTLDESGTAWTTEPPDAEAPAYQQFLQSLQEMINSRAPAEHGHSAGEVQYQGIIGNTAAHDVGEALDALAAEVENYPKHSLPIARGIWDSGDEVYYATGENLPEVEAGSNGRHIGKGAQIVFIPDVKSYSHPKLVINYGDEIEIRMRSDHNKGTEDDFPEATEEIPAGTLMCGVPYTLTFCGKYWLVDSHVSIVTPHSASHGIDMDDEITPAEIGAVSTIAFETAIQNLADSFLDNMEQKSDIDHGHSAEDISCSLTAGTRPIRNVQAALTHISGMLDDKASAEDVNAMTAAVNAALAQLVGGGT